MRKLCIAIGVIFTVLVVINSQTTAQEEEIYGCVSNRDGKLRIVSDPSECNIKKETSISWNQSGLQGPPGPEGPTGLDGLSCWDINENRLCDQETEDRNNDGACNALDCQGGVHVSDADGNYLGILSGLAHHNYVLVFNPTLGAFVVISNTGSIWYPDLMSPWNQLYYENTVCTGTPYHIPWPAYPWIVPDHRINKCYIDGEPQSVLAGSRYEGVNDSCTVLGPAEELELVELTEVTLPFPFFVKVPLKFK